MKGRPVLAGDSRRRGRFFDGENVYFVEIREIPVDAVMMSGIFS